MPFHLFDIDGCLVDDNRRRHLLPNYDEYHDAATEFDPLINHKTLRACIMEQHTPVFITGRPEHYRERTTAWCRNALHTVGAARDCSFILMMRPSGDTLPSHELKPYLLRSYMPGNWHQEVVAAWDDNPKVVGAYRAMGIHCAQLLSGPLPLPAAGELARPGGPVGPRTAAEILDAMATTFRERNKEYGQNYKNVAPIIRALFPDGVPSELVTQTQWHIFELIVVKLSRYATSNLTHRDSIHDAGVYCAMIASELELQQEQDQ